MFVFFYLFVYYFFTQLSEIWHSSSLSNMHDLPGSQSFFFLLIAHKLVFSFAE